MLLTLAMAWVLLVPPSSATPWICEPRPACEVRAIPVSLARLDLDAGRVTPVRLTMPADSPRQKLFEYSDQYAAQATLHRIASYATLPLFLTEFIAGQALLNPPGWAKRIHGPAAGAVAGLFLLNSVTGVLNAMEAMPDPAGRGRRTIHGLLMLIADAGFVATGVTAATAGRYIENTNRVRTTHRKYALASMGVATVGYLMMLPPFRRD
jgi:hypothetical protein